MLNVFYILTDILSGREFEVSGSVIKILMGAYSQIGNILWVDK